MLDRRTLEDHDSLLVCPFKSRSSSILMFVLLTMLCGLVVLLDPCSSRIYFIIYYNYYICVVGLLFVWMSRCPWRGIRELIFGQLT